MCLIGLSARTATTFLANWLPHAQWRHATTTPPPDAINGQLSQIWRERESFWYDWKQATVL